MEEYWLKQNLMYNCKHVERVTWWRKIFCDDNLVLSRCNATSEKHARQIFKERGYDAGILGQLID